MISRIQRSKSIPLTQPLPPSWIRRHPTLDDDDATNSARLLRVGPKHELHRALIEAIEGAQDVVCVASFLLADQQLCRALVAASERKVRVYLLTASENRLRAPLDSEDSFDARMVEEHKQLLKLLADKMVLRSASHFHAKFLIVDPHLPTARGWLSTANFNLALTKSIELGLALEREALEQVAGWFAWVFWNEAEHELAGPTRLAAVDRPPGSPGEPRLGSVFATTKQHRQIRAELVRVIRAARRELWVSSYGLDVEHEVVQALIDQAKAGVKVVVLTRPRPAVAKAVQALSAAGVTVLAHDRLHAKAIYSDAGSLVTTANLEAHGLDNGFELAVRVTGDVELALKRTLENWSESFPWRFEASASPRDCVGDIILIDKGVRDVQKVVASKEVVLKAIIARDVREVDDAPEPAFALPQGQLYAAALDYMWTVEPPTLPKGAKPLQQTVEESIVDKQGKTKIVKRSVPYDPPVFEHGGECMVAIRSEVQLEAAIELAHQLKARIVVQ